MIRSHEEVATGMVRLGEEGPYRAEIAVSLLVILVLAVVSVGPLLTPGPPAETASAEFSVERAMEHVANIAREPHPMGSTAIAEVREYLVAELTALGLDAELQSVEAPDYFGEPGVTVDVVNVMARIPGDDPTKAVVLMAHYDTVPTTPGANDDSAAVGVLLETGRALLAGPRLRNDVILLFTDGEEPAPRFGSAAFVTEHPWADDVAFVMNLEAASGSGPSVLFEITGPGRWVIDGFAVAVPHPVGFSFLTETAELIGGIGTDFDSFTSEDVPGLNFAYLRDSSIYHTPRDSIDSVDPGSVGHHGSHALGVARHFGSADLSQPRGSGDAVFFTVMRSLLVRYPADWAFPLAVLAAGLLGIASGVRFRRGESSVRAVLLGVGMMLSGMIVAVLVATVLWWIVTGVRSTPGVAESYVYLAGLTALIAGGWASTRRLARRRLGAVDWLGGVTLVWLVFAFITSATAPGMSYLFVWPTLVASTVMLVPQRSRGERRWLAPVALAFVAAPTLLLLVPAADTLFQMSIPRPGNPGSEMTAVIAVALSLAFLSVALIASVIAHSRGEHSRPGVDSTQGALGAEGRSLTQAY